MLAHVVIYNSNVVKSYYEHAIHCDISKTCASLYY